MSEEQPAHTEAARISHTPEPWGWGWGCQIYTRHNGGDVAKETLIADTYQRVDGKLRTKDAQRIVECVNTLAGLRPEALADVIKSAQAVLSSIERAKKCVPRQIDPGSHLDSYATALAQSLAALKETNENQP